MSKLYASFLERPSEVERLTGLGRDHQMVVHDGWQWRLGVFQTIEQFENFIEFAGLSLTLVEEKDFERGGHYKRWDMDCEVEDKGFCDLAEVPVDAKKFKGLSNGSLVDCYMLKEGKVLNIYRPNPNYKDLYNPMPLTEEVEYRKTHWFV